jgi:hypothetical protein
MLQAQIFIPEGPVQTMLIFTRMPNGKEELTTQVYYNKQGLEYLEVNIGGDSVVNVFPMRDDSTMKPKIKIYESGVGSENIRNVSGIAGSVVIHTGQTNCNDPNVKCDCGKYGNVIRIIEYSDVRLKVVKHQYRMQYIYYSD